MSDDKIRATLDRSSFGTPEAQEAIASIDTERARRLVERAARSPRSKAFDRYFTAEDYTNTTQITGWLEQRRNYDWTDER